MTSDLLTWNSRYPTGSPTISTSVPSTAPYEFKNLTAVTFIKGSCTGCALPALNPRATAYNSNLFGNWTSLVVTETILTEFVTYLDGSTIDTVVTELKTVNQTKTVDDITDTAAEFNIYLPTPGLELTLQVGPTYVLYTGFIGGLDAQIAAMALNNATQNQLKPTQNICRPHISSLRNWAPTRTEDWNYFIQTFNGSAPEQTAGDRPLPVPSKLVNFLAQDPEFQDQFQGADIKTCTLAGTTGVLIGDPSRTFQPDITGTETKTTAAASSSAPFFSGIPGTNTYLSTTYLSTSKHITKQGCLRCDTDPGELPKTSKPTEQDPNANKVNDNPVPTKSPNPKNDDNPKTDGNPQGQPQNTPQNTPDVKTTPNVPDIWKSIISDNPNLTKNPQDQPTDSGQSITVGNSVVAVKPQPTKQSQNEQSAVPTVVVIGTQSLTVGQTTMINGVPVVVPTGGRGSTIIVGDKTIDISPRITQAPLPVLTVGHNTITANSQGQFVIGAQTLQRGGPELTINGYTLTLGPNSKIAMWNSASATLINMAGPSAVPAVSFGEQLITAKTLAPGSAITIDGATFSLPPGLHGSSVVVNGQTQRLKPGLPALTIDNSLVTATVADGTTEFVLASGEILTPGGVIIISGTTYSLPTTGLGSTVVINGIASRLNPSHLPVLPFSREVVTATVAHGTTAFIFGPGATLTPGGMITVSGTTLSLPASGSGSIVVINGVTSTLMGSIISAPPIVVDGKTITATTRDGTAEYVLNSATTLRPDGQIIIDGTTYSLAPGGTALIVNGKTSLISSTPASNSASVTSTGSSSETTSERGAGDFIASGIGETSKGAGSWAYGVAADKWVESLVMGVAGWLLWLL
ncbi:hypothetical protein EJ07DRAFT_166429 [Lizonia empirigonia]|nr:hypothetical protein EJ07DRAFT_166429 [Lizonia empirigonia]